MPEPKLPVNPWNYFANSGPSFAQLGSNPTSVFYNETEKSWKPRLDDYIRKSVMIDSAETNVGPCKWGDALCWVIYQLYTPVAKGMGFIFCTYDYLAKLEGPQWSWMVP